MNPATIIVCILLSLLVFVLPRRKLLLPFIIAACLVPMNQNITIASLHFTSLRILIFVCMLRLLIRGEIQPLNWNSFDKLFLKWNIIGTFIYLILWSSLQALIYKSGEIYDNIGLYWIFRQCIRSFDDITDIINFFAISTIISAPLTAAEKINQYSFYSIFGPIEASFHRGRFQCAGPFPHFIIMGVFWSSLLPLFYAKTKAQSHPIFYWTAIITALICVYFSAASTPIMTIASMVLFWKIYIYRANGKFFLWFTCFILLALHLIMKAPVWHLMSRVDIFGGSTGWHRYNLFNQFINHASEWFFLGTKSTAHWDSSGQLVDITNQYVLEAVRGGAITLFLFIILLYNAVKITGKYSLLEDDIGKKFISWGVCVSLLGHIITFWGVSYFGQILMLFTLTLAIVGFIHEKTIKKQASHCSPLELNNKTDWPRRKLVTTAEIWH